MAEVAETGPAPQFETEAAVPRTALIALGWGMLITSIGNNFLITVMPPLARDMGLKEFQLGLLFAISGVFMLITGPMWGRVSEAWGRKPILLMGGIGYVVTNTAFGWVIDWRLAGTLTVASTFTWLLATRALYTLTSGAVYPATVAMVADLTSRKKRSAGIAFIGATWGLGSVVGPVVAAALSGFGPTMTVYVISAFAVVSVLLYAFMLHEPARHVHQEPPDFRKVLTPQTLSIVSAFGLLIMGNVGLMVCLGFHFQDEFHLDAAATTRAVGWALTAQAFAQIFVQIFVLRRIHWSPRAMVSFGMPLVAVASLIVMFTTSYWVAVAAMVLMGFGGGFGWPAFMTASSLSAGPENQGSVAGLTMSFQAIGFIIGPMIGTVAYGMDHAAPFYIQIGVVIALVGIVNLIRMPKA